MLATLKQIKLLGRLIRSQCFTLQDYRKTVAFLPKATTAQASGMISRAKLRIEARNELKKAFEANNLEEVQKWLAVCEKRSVQDKMAILKAEDFVRRKIKKRKNDA